MAENPAVPVIDPLPAIDYGVPTPPPPTSPVPTDQDVYLAHKFKMNVTGLPSTTAQPISVAARAAAIRYDNQVASARAVAGHPPTWLAPLLGQLKQELTDEFKALSEGLEQRLTAKIDALSGRVDAIVNVTTRDYVIRARRDNHAMMDANHLEKAPFPDGPFPWNKTVDGPNNTDVFLPPIGSVDSVRNLTTPETYGYFKRYYPGESMPSVGMPKRKILDAIGRGDDM